MNRQKYPLEILVIGVLHVLIGLTIMVISARFIILDLLKASVDNWIILFIVAGTVGCCVAEISIGSRLLVAKPRAYKAARRLVEVYVIYGAFGPLFARLILGETITPRRWHFAFIVLVLAAITYIGLNTVKVKEFFAQNQQIDDESDWRYKIVGRLIDYFSAKRSSNTAQANNRREE
ncbi:MAG: hypothetical protein GY832_17325 [Chloroflexi bacterium]|nr:hypothetical protein [Chloroflexota bacterium]